MVSNMGRSAYQFLEGDCPLIWPLVPTALTSYVSSMIYGDPLYLNGVCNFSTKSFGSNIKIIDVWVQHSETTPIVLLGNEKQYDLELTNVTFGETPHDDFPYSNQTTCYNTILNGEICQHQKCIEKGNRDALIPCCGEYDPQSGGQWGKCI